VFFFFNGDFMYDYNFDFVSPNPNDHVKFDSDGSPIASPRAIRHVAESDRVTLENLQHWRPGVTGFIQYWRTGVRNTIRGVVVVQYDHNTNTYRMGWAMRNLNDKYDHRRGLATAFSRLNVNAWFSANDGIHPSYMAYIPERMHDLAFNRLLNMHNNSIRPSDRVVSASPDISNTLVNHST
jgi:hypothetical protein